MNSAYRRQEVAKMLRAYGREAKANGTTINIGMNTDEMASMVDPTCEMRKDNEVFDDFLGMNVADYKCHACEYTSEALPDAPKYCPHCGARVVRVIDRWLCP